MSHEPPTDTDVRPTSLRVKRLKVRVVAGPDAGLVREFDERLRIGSRALADLRLSDPRVSGVHCELSADRGIRIRDLESKNGTWCGQLRLFDGLLGPNTVVTIGDTQLSVEPAEPSSEVVLSSSEDFHGLVGGSVPMRRLIAQVERLGKSDATVLILGETGTGKERVAQALHEGGARAKGPLVVVDCASLPANLIESELFGHERGAFTGAIAAHAGAFERADGGTLFLDEIGELPLELQSRLLRAIESRSVQRLGGNQRMTVNVRVVAATHRDLMLEVARGRFREDLYFRLAVVVLEVPPLRSRLDDVPLLARHLLESLGIDPHHVLTPQALQLASTYQWPGNVRELRNALERSVALMQPLSVNHHRAPPVGNDGGGEIDVNVPFREAKQAVIDAFERRYLEALLKASGGNISEAARRAKLDRMSIHRALTRHDLGRKVEP